MFLFLGRGLEGIMQKRGAAAAATQSRQNVVEKVDKKEVNPLVRVSTRSN